MSSLTATAMPIELMRPVSTALKAAAVAPNAAESARRAAIAKTAKDYEASFVSSMLGNMFQGVETSAPFGGGEGEKAFKSFLMDAIAKKVTQAGGVGVAASVQREILKMQGLS